MLILCKVDIQDLSAPGQKKGRPLKSCVLSKKINDTYFVCVKNAMYPNSIDYRIADLEVAYCKFVKEGKLGLRFRRPEHLVLLKSENPTIISMFARQVQNMVDGKKVVIAPRLMPNIVPARKDADRFSPLTRDFVAVAHFDNRVLNMKFLNKLILEKCKLPTLPVQVGDLPVEYLSLADSDLGSSRRDQDVFWDWMAGDGMRNSLLTLILDNIGLKTLPFEVSFLQKLQSLSVLKNKLTYLPPYIGELKQLRKLYVANNMLTYFPESLYSRTFQEIDISDNKFSVPDTYEFDHLCKYQALNKLVKHNGRETPVPKLSHLSFCSLVSNCVVHRRRDIPRTLWHYYNVVVRCIHCHKFVFPDYFNVKQFVALPTSINLIKNHPVSNITWQSAVCQRNCSPCK